jgi:eukaryotic translation initiation factor 2-alpha kinase 4
MVHDCPAAIFHLHGAVDMEPPLLMPVLDPEEKSQATFIDRHGDVVTLPNNILVPFARLAARETSGGINVSISATSFVKSKVFISLWCCKRLIWCYSTFFSPVAGHPKVLKAAVFNVITPDLEYGPVAASTEIISVVNDCLDSFPNLAQSYDIHISHSKCKLYSMNSQTKYDPDGQLQ